MGVHDFWGLRMAPPGSFLGRDPYFPLAQSPQGNSAGQAEMGRAGVSLSTPPRWQGPRGIQESEAEPWFVAGSPAGPA